MTSTELIRRPFDLRAGAVGAVVVLAAAVCSLRPDSTSELLAGTAVLLGAGVALWPREPLLSVCLLALVGEYASVTTHFDFTEATLTSLLLASALYAVHSLFSLLGIIGPGVATEVERSVVVRCARRAGAIGIVGGLAVLVMGEFAAEARPAWTIAMSIVGATGLAVTFVLALRAERTGRRAAWASNNAAWASNNSAVRRAVFAGASLVLIAFGIGAAKVELKESAQNPHFGPVRVSVNWCRTATVSTPAGPMRLAKVAGHTVTFLLNGNCVIDTANRDQWTVLDNSADPDLSHSGRLLDRLSISSLEPGLGCVAGSSRPTTIDFAHRRATYVSTSDTCDLAIFGPLAPAPPTKSSARHSIAPLVGAVALGLITLLFVVWWLRQRRRAVRRSVSAVQVLDEEKLEEPIEEVEVVEAGLLQALRSIDLTADPREAVLLCWVGFEEAVRAHGLPRGTAETPMELASRVIASVEADVTGIEALCEWYRDARYSRHPVRPEVRDDARELIATLLRELNRANVFSAS